jgi:hypothetical protein
MPGAAANLQPPGGTANPAIPQNSAFHARWFKFSRNGLAFSGIRMDSHTHAAPQRRPRLRVSPAVTSQRIGDDAVLIDLRTNEIYEMNRTGARMWQLLGDGLDVDDIKRQLEAEFEIEAEELHRQMDSFLATLLDAKLVENE